MEVILLAIGFVALSFAGIAIKILVKKNGEFAGTCASQSPFLNKKVKLVDFAVLSLKKNARK